MITWGILLFASSGVFHHSGIKMPFFAFFAHDSGIRCKEAPTNMLIAMGITASLCILIGIFPEPLYSILPYSVDYAPYTTPHVISQLQLLIWSALAFTFLKRTGIYPAEMRLTNLDTDWVYRRLMPASVNAFVQAGAPIRDACIGGGKQLVTRLIDRVKIYHVPGGVFARTWMTGRMVLLVTLFLLGYLVLYF